MFTPDVVSLRQFYASPFGDAVRVMIMRSIHRFWGDIRKDALLGVGYVAPYVDSYMAQAGPLVIAMPAQQGAVYWPSEGPNRMFLTHESELPLQENSVNRVLLIHSIEHSDQLAWMMREAWRVLTPGGRVLAVVPNRMGFWARSSRSPFGYGRPFSTAQLRDLLIEHDFTLTRSATALFIPPTYSGVLWRFAPKIEKLGRLFCRFIGGVVLMEAEKQVYAAIRQGAAAKHGYRVATIAPKPVMGRQHPG